MNTLYRLSFTLVAFSLVIGLSPAPALSAPSLTEFEQAIVDVVDRISPSVVSVKVKKTIQQQTTQQFQLPFGEEFFRRFFPAPEEEIPQERNNQFRQEGGGSGFIVSEDGYILTNHHVISNADSVTVTLADGKTLQAEVVGSDSMTDVGVIKIDAQNLTPLEFGNSDNLRVGQWVIAIGNPIGFSHTVTTGVVSAKGRSNVQIANIEDFIQTDAAINPGNSGGPMVNLNGNVVGMNTAIVSHTGGYMGIGFAIPSGIAQKVYQQIIDHGSVEHGYLGIYIGNLNEELAQAFGVDRQEGILISEVTENSPAQRAGLRRGDVIIELNGKPVNDSGKFRNEVAFLKPGSTHELTVIRNGKRKTLSITIGTHPESGQGIAAQEQKEQTYTQLGFTVQPLTPELAERFGYKEQQGVIVSQVKSGSQAEDSGIRPGMMILEVNQKPVTSVSEFHNVVKNAAANQPILLYVYDGEFKTYIALRPEK